MSVIGRGSLVTRGGRLIVGRGGLFLCGCVRVARGLILVVWGATRWGEVKNPAGRSGWASRVLGGSGVESRVVELRE
jgi:hypothetical protein